jgi:hypothetical protein
MYNRLRATIGLPLQFIMLHTNDYIPDKEHHNNLLLFSPSLNISYKLSPYWEVSGNGSYRNNLGGINSAYSGYLMSSYRSLRRNEGRLLEQQSQSYGIGLSYRNPIYALFGNLGASYSQTKANLLFGIKHTGILSEQTTYDMPNITEGVTVQGNLSKGLDVISSTLSIGGSYTTSGASQINQGALVRYSSQMYAANGSLDTRIKRWASLSYRLSFMESKNKVDNNDRHFAPIRTYSQQAQLNLFPIKNMIMNLNWEYFYNSAIESGSRNMSFGNINMRYKFPKIELLFDYTNIFNAKEYTSASYGNTTTLFYAYDLRPTEILLKVRFKIK